MERVLGIIGGAVLLALLWLAPASAQQSNLYCQTGSGTGPSSWLPWSTANPCPVSATITPSGTQNVNITQILGAAPGLTNPLFVSPASGATFPVSGTVTTTSGSPYPSGAVALTGNGSGTTGSVVGTLTAAATSTTAYICGFSVSAVGTGAVGPITIAGLIGSSQVWQLTAVATGGTVSSTFSPCIPASAVNTNITITTTADATASAVNVNSWGFRQ